jgi:hypothetical protein
LDEIPHFTIFEEILYHIWKPDAECLKLEVMKKAHEESGHYGHGKHWNCCVNVVIGRIWPKM